MAKWNEVGDNVPDPLNPTDRDRELEARSEAYRNAEVVGLSWLGAAELRKLVLEMARKFSGLDEPGEYDEETSLGGDTIARVRITADPSRYTNRLFTNLTWALAIAGEREASNNTPKN